MTIRSNVPCTSAPTMRRRPSPSRSRTRWTSTSFLPRWSSPCATKACMSAACCNVPASLAPRASAACGCRTSRRARGAGSTRHPVPVPQAALRIAALAAAACDLRRVAESTADLRSSTGSGRRKRKGEELRAEIAEVMAAAIPVLIAVRADLLGAWATFLGTPAMRLPPGPQPILSWIRPLVRTRAHARVTAWPD